MEKNQNIEWLINTSGPILRYRTKKELHHFATQKESEDAVQELLNCSEVKKWRKLLQESSHLHGSDSYAFENSLAKLAAYGIRANMADFSDIIRLIYSKLTIGQKDNLIVYPHFISIMYTEDIGISAYAQKRLDTLYDYAKKSYNSFSSSDDATDLLLSKKEKKELHISSHWKDKHVLKPEITLLLPNCYDFYLFAYMSGHEKKRNTILKFVNTPKFQRLCELREFERAYGWDSQKNFCWSTWEMPYFHGYNGFDTGKFSPNKFMLYLDLTSQYPIAREIEWYKRGIEHLECFKTKDGHYKFPSKYLLERANGYYLYTGARLRLGEVGKAALEIESTFRMELMKKRLSV